MPESLLERSKNIAGDILSGYRFDHLAFVAMIENLKKNPTDDMKAWMSSQSVHKTWTCAALAAYSGLSEASLKKLKRGEVDDPRGSTFVILFVKFRIRPRDVLNCLPPDICSLECANQARIQLKESLQRIAELETARAADHAELERLRRRVLEERTSATSAQERVNAFEKELKGSHEKIRQNDKGVITRNWIIVGLVAALILMMGLAIYFLWEAMNPYKGNFRV